MPSLSYLQRLEQVTDFVVIYLKLKAPKKTMNLAVNGIRKAFDDQGVPFIVIGGEPAPYAIYTNEPWISDHWLNKKTGVMAVNPNMGWIWQAVTDCVPYIQSCMNGPVNEDELYIPGLFQNVPQNLAEALTKGW